MDPHALDSHGTSTYRLPRDHGVYERWVGYFMGAVSIGFVIKFLLTDPSEYRVGYVIAAMIFCVFAFMGSVVSSFNESQTVEIDSDGVMSHMTGAKIPWSRVVRLRNRPLLQQVQLLGPSGGVLAVLDYNLKGFERALAEVIEHVEPLRRNARDFEPIHARQAWGWIWTAILVGIVLFFAWQAIWDGFLLALVAAGAFFVAYLLDSVTNASHFKVDYGVVSIREGLKTRRIDLAKITNLRLRLRKLQSDTHSLDVFMVADGKRTWFNGRRYDPVRVYFAIRDANPKAIETP